MFNVFQFQIKSDQTEKKNSPPFQLRPAGGHKEDRRHRTPNHAGHLPPGDRNPGKAPEKAQGTGQDQVLPLQNAPNAHSSADERVLRQIGQEVSIQFFFWFF